MIASAIAAVVILILHSEGSYVDSIFDFRPRRAGRMIVEGPLAFGAWAMTAFAAINFLRRLLKG